MAARLAWIGGAALAAALAALGLQLNLAAACNPTRPADPFLCADPAPADAARLRAHLATQPGAAAGYVRLLQADAADAGALRAASLVAPAEPNVRYQQARHAIEQQRLADAVALLVPLTELYLQQSSEPADILARLIAFGHADLLKPYLRPGSRWLTHVLDRMVHLRLPLAPAVPLLTQARGDLIDAARLRTLVAQLKAAGDWVGAYGLWMARHGQRVPLLYNASFEHPFERDGFDWEAPRPLGTREGVRVEQRSMAGHGHVVELQFNGRSFSLPLVRQYLLAGPGVYRLTGRYRTEQLRSEGGLAWAVLCAPPGAAPVAGRSAPLTDTRGTWESFAFDFKVPEDCGPVVSLQLEPAQAFEATAGLRGRAQFDAFSLQAPAPGDPAVQPRALARLGYIPARPSSGGSP